MIKSLKFVALAAALLMGTNAQAGPITGSQNFNSGLPTANTGSVLTATSFGLNGNTTGGSQVGDFVGYPWPEALDNTSLTVASLASFSFGSVAFGTFQATTGIENLTVSPGTREFRFLGTFTPGSNSHWTAAMPPFTATPGAGVLLNFNQSGGPSGAIGLSWSMDMSPDGNFITAVPEPGSMAIALSGLGLGLFFNRRRLFTKKV